MRARLDSEKASDKLHIMHLSTVHAWDDVRIYQKQVKSALAAGLKVSLVARQSRHQRGDLPEFVHVLREFRSRGTRMFLGSAIVLIKALRVRADVYQFHDPELIPVGLFLRLMHKKVIYDVHENVPDDIMEKPYLPGWCKYGLSKLVELVEMACGRVMNGIVGVNATITSRFPAHKTCIVENAPILSEFFGGAERLPRPESKLKLAYVGVCTPERGIYTLIDWIEGIDCTLVLAGRFSSPDFKGELEQLPGWSKVQYLGEVPRSRAIKELMSADVGVILFHPTKNNIHSSPNKLFEYMAAGLPVVASDFKPWRKAISVANCGYLIDPLDRSQFVDAINELAGNVALRTKMGESGTAWVKTNKNWDLEFGRLMEFIENRVLGRQSEDPQNELRG